MKRIPNKTLKLAVKPSPEFFAELFRGIFPTAWKRRKLILSPKAGKLLVEPPSYRPYVF